MQIVITPPQFIALEGKLSSEPDVTLKIESPTTGTITNPDVTLGYKYDGRTFCAIDILERHSFVARVATELIIENRIRALFAKAIAE